MLQTCPVIPASEFTLRRSRVQGILEKSGLDILLAYSDDRACHGNAYARYFADVPAHFEEILLLFVRSGDPVLLTGPETVCYAAEVGSFPHMEALSEFADPTEDYPFIELHSLADVLRRYAGAKIRRVGLAGTRYWGAKLLQSVREAIPGAEFLEADEPLQQLRSIKTPSEIAVIRYAYQIASAGIRAAYEAIRPGLTEREIAAEAEYAMRSLGAEGYGIDPIVASGPNSRHILARTTLRRIEPNDVVLLTLAPRYAGYHGACGRTVLVGDPGAATVRSVEAGIEAQAICAGKLRDGLIGRDAEQAGRERMAAAGYRENFSYSGLHSIGVEEFEPPILGPSSNTVLRTNMVVSIDIPLFEARDVYGSRIEDGYLIKQGDPECLTAVERLLRK